MSAEDDADLRYQAVRTLGSEPRPLLDITVFGMLAIVTHGGRLVAVGWASPVSVAVDLEFASRR